MKRGPKSDACRTGEHEECDRLAWMPGEEDPVYCSCTSCGCDGIGQEALV